MGEKNNAQAVLHECVAMLVVRSSEAFRHPSCHLGICCLMFAYSESDLGVRSDSFGKEKTP